MNTPEREGEPVEISVVCAVGRHVKSLTEIHGEIAAVIEETGQSAEFIYVVDGPSTGSEEALNRIPRQPFPVRTYGTARGFGEATALQYGIEQARGRYVITIADRPQIDPRTLIEVLRLLHEGREVVVTRRDPRSDAFLNRLQSRAFHGLIEKLVGESFRDLSCGMRGFSTEAARRLELYGDQHRFIPLIATRLGYRVIEIPGRQHEGNTALRLRRPGIYARRLLDILNIYFLTKFTRKPLRFFGLIGLTVGGLGFAITAWMAGERLLGLSALADRPLLLLGILLIVLGVQIMSIGLLGEIIIFLSTKRETPEILEILTLEDQVVPIEEGRTRKRETG